MALGPMGWTAMILAVVILSLTFGPGWSLVFLILVGVIFGEVHEGKQEEQEEQEKQNLLDGARARDALAHITINVPADASDHAPVEVHKGKQEEQEKQNLPDSAPARGALDHLTINVPADASHHASAHAPVEVHKGKQEEQEKQNLPDSASDHAPADASDHAPADVVDVPADGLAFSVDAPTPVVDAPASLADAPALSGDSLAPAVDDPADAALPVDAPADAPAISADAQVDAPVDASALAPAVVAAGIRMRRKGLMKKMVVKLDLLDGRDRRKAMKVVSGFGGIGSLNMDTEDNKLTVSGDFDPVKVVNTLRKSWHTEIVSAGPAKEDDGNKNENPVVKANQAYYSRPNCVIC